MKRLIWRLASATEDLTNVEAALILALGLALGTFPAPGCPTLLCLLAAAALRLNLPALQIVNHLSSPLQIALLIPYSRLGSRIVGAHPGWRWGAAALDAIAGWFFVTIPLAFILFLVSMYFLRNRRQECFQ